MRALLCGAAIVALTGPAPAAGLKTLYTFTGGVDGGFSFAGLLPGPNGSFFGTTTLNAGSVFQLSPPAQGQSAWTLTTLYTFTDGADGNFPQTLVMDAGGALYGMADHGGTRNGVCASGGTDIGCGTVWRLAPPAQGQTAWQFSVLWSFKGGVDGASPTGGVTFGPSGELYGFTYGGFTCGSGVCGGVFRLTPPGRGMNGWTETTLYSFKGGTDGGLAGSYGPPVLDANGVIYGVTGIGGNVRGPNCKGYGCGTVFSLSPPAGGQTAWTKSALLVFGGRNGIQPIGGLTLDAAGNLFGGTNEGGRLADCVPGKGYPNGCGVAFEVSPAGGGAWQSKVRFTNAADGGYPFGAPLHVGGTVYATTSGDEVNSFGSLVALKPAGATRRAQVLFTFTNDADSSSPTGNLVAQGGALFGTTVGAGSGPAPYGTVYSYTP
jgi:hypothetical protein